LNYRIDVINAYQPCLTLKALSIFHPKGYAEFCET